VVSAYEASCRSLPSGTEGEVSSGEEDNGLDSDDDEVRSPLVKTISSTLVISVCISVGCVWGRLPFNYMALHPSP
jgi:hypothetical protein